MSKKIELTIPDIGGATDVDVIEVLVNIGDKVEQEQSIVTLEGDKATMEVPAAASGIVKKISLHVGDKVSEGSAMIDLEVEGQPQVNSIADTNHLSEEKSDSISQVENNASQIQDVAIPDIGGASDVDVIEVMVSAGDEVDEEQSILTLEGDKATMEVPSPYKGKVIEVKLSVGDKVSEGDVVLSMEVVGSSLNIATEQQKSDLVQTKQETKMDASRGTDSELKTPSKGEFITSPIVRRLAREFDIDLKRIRATGGKGRITKDDILNYIKDAMKGGSSGLSVAALPDIDFSKFGEVEELALNKIKRSTGVNLHRNWISVPHVTQFGQADITEMETFRKEHKAYGLEQGARLTPLVFIMKAVVAALKAFPSFNSSLSSDGNSLILKKYYHIGIAVDTPDGLVVPVVRDVDKKGILDLARELGEISQKARDKKLTMKDFQGASFSISSLGGIGGTAFTPIVNMPEVAILGLSKASMQPVYQNDSFVPRLMLPLSLSYDHRVIDGAEGARFMVYLSDQLSDEKTLLL